MSESGYTFRLQVPAEPPFRTLAADMGRRFAEVLGAKSAVSEVVGREMAAAVEGLAGAKTASDAVVDVTYAGRPEGLEATLHCDGRAATVKQAFDAKRAPSASR